jgi:hypothetical protein
MKYKVRPNATWRIEPLGGKSQLVRLIAPLAEQRGREKTMCICIGSKRLKDIVPILNDLQVKV